MARLGACQALTRKGRPCSRRPSRGLAFCWLHRDRAGTIRKIVGGVIAALLASAISLFIWYSTTKTARIHEHFAIRPDMPRLTSDYAIVMGGNRSANMCGTGPFRFADDSLHLTADSECRPILDGVILDPNGVVVAEVSGWKLRVPD